MARHQAVTSSLSSVTLGLSHFFSSHPRAAIPSRPQPLSLPSFQFLPSATAAQRFFFWSAGNYLIWFILSAWPCDVFLTCACARGCMCVPTNHKRSIITRSVSRQTQKHAAHSKIMFPPAFFSEKCLLIITLLWIMRLINEIGLLRFLFIHTFHLDSGQRLHPTHALSLTARLYDHKPFSDY